MFKVPVTMAQIETSIKKSRFIASARYADDRSAAMRAIEKSRAHFPDAGHHCWAYLLGSPANPSSVAMSDDGEPSGTAGKPILNVLQHKDVGNVIVVVSRYFGGIKLGTGGLVRAYSGAAQAVMSELKVHSHVDKTQLSISIGFPQEQDLRHWLSTNQGVVLEISYSDRVNCLIEVASTNLLTLKQTALQRNWKIAPSDE